MATASLLLDRTPRRWTACRRSTPTPYECTSVTDSFLGDAGTRDVCLIPCTSGDDCPFNCCKGVSCGASVGKDGYCIFI